MILLAPCRSQANYNHQHGLIHTLEDPFRMWLSYIVTALQTGLSGKISELDSGVEVLMRIFIRTEPLVEVLTGYLHYILTMLPILHNIPFILQTAGISEF